MRGLRLNDRTPVVFNLSSLVIACRLTTTKDVSCFTQHPLIQSCEVSRTCLHKKSACGVNPRDLRDLKLAADGSRMTIASGVRFHKHMYY